MFQSHIQVLRPLTTAHLAQTMTLLSLSAAELRQQVEAELASNPALELTNEIHCPTCNRLILHGEPCPVCSRPLTQSQNEPIVFVSPREDFYTGNYSAEKDLPEDNYSSVNDDLPTYVFRQIAPELAEQDRKLAAFILTQLDEDGLLTTSLTEIALYHHVPISRIQSIIHIIQHAEPIGVGSSSPEEALLVQLEVLSEMHEIPPYAEEAIRSYLDLLSRHQYSELARKLGINLRQAQELARFIGENLNPFPGRSHWGDNRNPGDIAPQVYHQPDILISFLHGKQEDQLVVEVILPISGTLRVNPLFRQAIKVADEDKIDEWKADLEKASLFVKCLQQRNNTMLRLMQRLVNLQYDFIISGETSIKPLTRVQLAQELDVHESTISRAVSGKCVQLPNGRIVPLSKFFDRSLHVRTILRSLIEEEHRPFSDTELAALLTQKGYPVARRTVAKYRAMEGILPAHLRHSRFMAPVST
jgi:RNA polymerase sigma-54 factor